MKMKTSGKLKKFKLKPAKLFQIIGFVCFLILIFVTELFWRQPLYEAGVNYIIYFQRNANENFIKFLKLIKLMEYYPVLVFTLVLVYNFCNIYKTFVLISVLHFSWGISAILKMIYVDPRPFFDSVYDSKDITAVVCEAGWGNPGGTPLVLTSFLLTFWKLIFKESILMKEYIKTKFILFIVCLLCIIIMLFCCILTGIHSINQIIFGFILGISVYFLVFYILEVDIYNHTQFLNYINKYAIWNVVIYLVILVAGILLFNLRKFESIDYLQNINVKCSDTPNVLKLHEDSFIEILYSITIVAAIFGIKLEYIFMFNSHEKNWKDFNFNTEIEDNTGSSSDNYRLSLCLNDITQWNYTNFVISIIRIILSYFLAFLIYLPMIFINYDSNIFIVVILKIFSPLFLFYFSLFYIFKVIFKIFRLINFSYTFLPESLTMSIQAESLRDDR